MKFKVISFIVMLSFYSVANAYPLQKGMISGYLPYAEGEREVFFFSLKPLAGGGCNNTNRFAIDSNSKNFNSVVSAVMASFHSKQEVTIQYTAKCDTYSNSWDAHYICVGDIPC